MDMATNNIHACEGMRSFVRDTVMRAATRGLLDLETLSLAQSDPALSFLALHLFVAAVNSNTFPPSIQLPAHHSHFFDSTYDAAQPTRLSAENYPTPIVPT
ncbi:hypothetical protein OH77DRAFT_1421431 [Trametes cingulata]|nr:hypothetical protein OH77DRAFT_1421431 [Trametes cingulata]